MVQLLEKPDKPILEPIGQSLFGQYLGVESEYEVFVDDLKSFEEKDKRRRIILIELDQIFNKGGKNNNYCIFKKDDSLKFGIEICTRPASLDIHKLVWSHFFAKIPKYLEVRQNCGLHIHLSKNNMTNLQIGKIIRFVNRKENREFIYNLAGRGSCKHSNFNHEQDISSALPKNFRNGRHYDPVNILNKNTVELRIFANTLDRNIFQKNLDFCAALVQFTVASSRSILEATDCEIFKEFVVENQSYYPSLYNFLK